MNDTARQLTLYLDGGSRGNPGPAGAGVVLTDAATDEPLQEVGYFLGPMTNNAAEYNALLCGLVAAAQVEPTTLIIYSDSELLVRQITGQYKVKSKDLQPLFEQAQSKLIRFENWSIRHVGRELNKRADELANQAMDAGADVIDRDALGLAASGDGDVAGEPPDEVAGFGETREPAEAAGAADPPGWMVELSGTGACVSGCRAGSRYTVGTTMPAGLCVHAAAAMFASDPRHWPASLTASEARCDRCGLTVRIAVEPD